MDHVSLETAKQNLADLISKAQMGEDVIIEKDGQDVAVLRATRHIKRAVSFGVLKGKITVSDDFDKDLPAATLALFEGR